MGTTGTHAAVLGASMAGLTIAQALGERFDRVTVVERDDLADRAEPRRGVPQSRHVHVLQLRGKDALEALFPGLSEDLIRDGAVASDWGERGRITMSGHRFARQALGRNIVSASRPLLEQHVRRRVRSNPRVDLAHGCDVLRPVTTADRRRVTGAQVRGRDEGGRERTLSADLVIDCTGRGSQAPRWLEELGYASPPVDTVRVDLRYSSRHYRLPPRALGDDTAAIIGPTPAVPRGGVMFRIEGDRWLVTLIGVAGEAPPSHRDDDAAFQRYAASLVDPDLREAIEVGEPLDEPVIYRFPGDARVRYERLRRLPDGLLVAGDAVCSFNPVYGQGMTVAALEAVALRDLLSAGEVPSPRTWFGQVADIVRAPWDMAVGADLSLPQIDGRRTLATRALNAYVARLHAAAAHDPVVAERFVRVVNMLDDPARLLQPSVFRRVFRRRPAGREVDEAEGRATPSARS